MLIELDHGKQSMSQEISDTSKKIYMKIWEFIKINKILNSFLMIAVLPSLIYMAYITVWAAPQFDTEFRIQIRAPGNMSMPSFGALLGVTGGSSSASDNGYAVTQYLVSKNAIEDLDKKIALRKRYSAPSIDWFSRLPSDAPIEKVQRYWDKHVSASFESTTGTVIVRVSAFTAKDSKDIANASLELSEALLNKMSGQVRTDSVRYASEEVENAEKRMHEVDAELLLARNQTGIIDVPKQVSLYLSRVSNIQQQVDLAEADLQLRRRYLYRSAPGLKLAEQRLRVLNLALDDARAALSKPTGRQKQSLAQAANRLDQLEAYKQVAEKRLQGALMNLNTAESDAQRQQLYLERIVSPHLAEEASYPRLLKDGGEFLAFAIAAWGLILVLGFAIRDHLPH
jgi:capsular polysaccharide transport system permease protein